MGRHLRPSGIILLGAILLVGGVAGAGFDGFTGDYCATRSDACCLGRLDDCSVPVYGTRCYCDEFCNRTRDDCCPDYWKVCVGIELAPEPEPYPRCYDGSRYYNYGEETKINCNKCKCESIGMKVEFVCERNTCLLEAGIINGVNADRTLGWRAANYTNFWGRPLIDGINLRTGTLQPHQSVKNMEPVSMRLTQTPPPTFDSRTKWHSLIGNSLDQGWCNASWVISTVDVAGDRFGVLSEGRETVRLSGQHLLSCGNRGQQGCHGGHLSRAWMYIRKFGLVDEDCYPWNGGVDSRCKLSRKANLLTARCKPAQTYRTDFYKVGPAYRVKGEQEIMSEIITSGPVQATMKVYQDFFSYKGGVYRRSWLGDNRIFGYHSVRLVGWGAESDFQGRQVKYWNVDDCVFWPEKECVPINVDYRCRSYGLYTHAGSGLSDMQLSLAVNSWGPYWGENGLFKIVRGTNECEIEDFVLAVSVWTNAGKSLARPTERSNNLIF